MPPYVYVQLGNETYYAEIDSTFTQRDDWLRKSVCTFEMVAHTSISRDAVRISQDRPTGRATIVNFASHIDVDALTTLSVFLQRRTMTPMHADISRSLRTRQYDTALLPPYLTRPLYLVECQPMVQLMVADLFSRVLLQGPPTVDPDALQDAETIVASYEASFANHVLNNESSVTDATTPVFRACIKAIEAAGASFQLDREHTNADAGVRMNSIVHLSRLDGASAGIACEDKTPAVYDNCCNDGQVVRMCGWLELEQPETGFRAILLKLALYMIAENYRWGIINCALKMRIVRIDHRDADPIVIISKEIPRESPPNESIYSLICYMLLTAKEELGYLDQFKIRAVLHTTAAGGAVLADICMARVDEVPGSPTDPHTLDVDISYLIGAGEVARVFRGETFIDDEITNGPIAVKLFNEDCEEYLVTEAVAYRMLRSLYDVDIPRYYGHFSGERNGFEYSAILLSYCGAALETFDSLTQEERSKIFAILQKVHRAGVKHNDFRPSNILRSEQGAVRLADFSSAHTDHHCDGTGACEELISAADELGLLRMNR
ncbi:hypothetical protein ACEPAG_4504 [Sanghuangporus baumii]